MIHDGGQRIVRIERGVLAGLAGAGRGGVGGVGGMLAAAAAGAAASRDHRVPRQLQLDLNREGGLALAH